MESKTSLFRYMPIHRLIEVIETGTLTFVKPIRWNDAFENYLSKVKFEVKGKIKHIDYLDNVFVSCWTTSSESDLFWRAYCPDKNGVRILVQKDSFVKLIREHINKRCFFYEWVEYHTYKDLKVEFENKKFLIRCYLSRDKSQLVKYLFKKRNEFSKEEEYRIIFDRNVWGKYNTDIEFFRISIDPTTFIQEIRFDPAMPDELCNVYKSYFINKGFKRPQYTIKRSMLYKYKVQSRIVINSS